MNKLALALLVSTTPLWALTVTFKDGDTLQNLQPKFQTYYKKIERVLNIDKTPLSKGDILTIKEDQTFDGHWYPTHIALDYRKKSKKDIKLVGDLVPNDHSWRYTVEFFDTLNRLKTTIWNNKKNNHRYDFENFNYLDIEIKPYLSINAYQNSINTSADILHWLIFNKKSQKLDIGDKVSFVETTFSWGSLVITHPKSLTIDFLDVNKKDISLAGELLDPNRDKNYRYTISFFDKNQVKKRTLYLNRKKPNEVFVLEFLNDHDVQFPIGNTYKDWNNKITLGYRVTDNPTPDRGGPATYFHRAIDYGLPTGTPLYAPYDGIAMASFIIKDVKELPKQHNEAIKLSESYGRAVSLTFDYPIAYSSTKGLETQQIKIVMAHLSAVAKTVGNQMIENRINHMIDNKFITNEANKQRSIAWYKDVAFSQDDDGMVDQMIEYNTWYKENKGHPYLHQHLYELTVKAGEMLAYSGNTGRSTGPHLHLEVFINGSYTNPLDFFRKYGTTHD